MTTTNRFAAGRRVRIAGTYPARYGTVVATTDTAVTVEIDNGRGTFNYGAAALIIAR